MQLPDLAAEKLEAGIARRQPVADCDDIGRGIKEALPGVLALCCRELLIAEHLGEIRQGAALLAAMRERDEIKRRDPDQHRDREDGQAAEDFGTDDCDGRFAR
jgi:hypothetical protein